MAMEMEVDDAPNLGLGFSEEELFKAAENGNSAIFAEIPFEEMGKFLSLRNDDDRSLLHVAVASGQKEVSREETTFSTRYEVQLDNGTTFPNIFPYILPYIEVVNTLIVHDSSLNIINSTDEEGWAPLHSAASSGHVDIVETLLNKGANVNLANNGGRTALHYAASKGRLKLAEILINHGANVNQKDKIGCTPLHRAASTGNSELCELLIEEGADVDAVDKAGQTPLMTAVICENKQVTLLLVRHGADVDVEDKDGYTALGRASNEFRPVIIDAAKAMLEG